MSTVRKIGVAAKIDPNARWKAATSVASTLVLSFLFLVSGIWKLTDLNATAERMIQSLIPVALSVPTAIAVAICETFTGILLLIPRFRRWGAWIAALMLVAFMIYIGVLYDRLLGEDCNCFPWLQRVVGPVLFVGDAVMLVLAVLAGWSSRKPDGFRHAAIILCCVSLLAGGAYAFFIITRGGADALETALVDGKPVRFRQGRFLLYFFDPECMHCYTAAQRMSRQNWGATRVVVLPTREVRFARAFLQETGLQAGISPDAARLREAFAFTDPPYAIALDQGKVVATFNSGQMELASYYESLKQLGHIIDR